MMHPERAAWRGGGMGRGSWSGGHTLVCGTAFAVTWLWRHARPPTPTPMPTHTHQRVPHVLIPRALPPLQGYDLAKKALLQLANAALSPPTELCLPPPPPHPPTPAPFPPQGYDLAKKAVLQFLEEFKEKADPADRCVWVCEGGRGLGCGRRAEKWLFRGVSRSRGMPQTGCVGGVGLGVCEGGR